MKNILPHTCGGVIRSFKKLREEAPTDEGELAGFEEFDVGWVEVLEEQCAGLLPSFTKGKGGERPIPAHARDSDVSEPYTRAGRRQACLHFRLHHVQRAKECMSPLEYAESRHEDTWDIPI